MRKKYLKRILAFILLAAIAFFWLMIVRNYNKREQTRANYQTLPEFTFYTFDNDTLLPAQLNDSAYRVIIFFDPSCDYCELELNNLEANIGDFETTQFALISSVPVDTLRKFATKFNFYAIPNINMYFAHREQLAEKFASYSVPSIFVYNPESRLIKNFTGYTRMNEIAKVINLDQSN